MVWDGPPEFSWVGLAAASHHAFDPETGTILGGWISWKSAERTGPLRDTPAGYLELIQPGMGAEDLTRIDSQATEFSGYRIPRVDILLQEFTAHELGHFGGLGHDFFDHGTEAGRRMVRSIMDYPPFALAVFDPRVATIREFDRTALRCQYSDRCP